MTPTHRELLEELQTFASTADTAKSLMERIAERLHVKLSRYNWVGFYLVDPSDLAHLGVGPFSGSFTPNARIPSTPDSAVPPPPLARSSSCPTFPKIRAI
jgi:putative methionine-R-sulfoxide reductase with GAF domain